MCSVTDTSLQKNIQTYIETEKLTESNMHYTKESAFIYFPNKITLDDFRLTHTKKITFY